MAASALAFFSSRRVMRSALAFTAALLASISVWIAAFSASSAHFFSLPNRGPLALDSLLRSAFSVSPSLMAARRSASSAMTSSTSGSLAFWNFLRMFSFTISGFSRMNLISSMLLTSYIVLVVCLLR